MFPILDFKILGAERVLFSCARIILNSSSVLLLLHMSWKAPWLLSTKWQKPLECGQQTEKEERSGMTLKQ